MFISPDGKVGAVPRYGDRANVGLLDLSTGNRPAFLKGKFLMTAVAFSRDGKTLWTGDTPEEEEEGVGRGRIRVWDIATKKSIRNIPAGRGVIYALALSDDGKTLAVAPDEHDSL